MPFERGSPDRIEFHGSLSPKEVDEIATNPLVCVLQASSTVDPETWRLLNEALFSRRADIALRLYGFYTSICDLSFLRLLPNLRRFCASCLQHAKHVECVASLPDLQALEIGIYDLESFEFLKDIQPGGITKLSLSATKSRKPSLGLLPRFSNLRTLYLEGQSKEIQVISQLAALEDLTLRSITIPGLEFLRGLKHLWSLDIKLGGTNNLKALEGLTGIKYLELWQIKDLRDIDVLTTLLGLQYLFLQSLPNITAIPDCSRLRALRRVYLENLKGLKDLGGLTRAPALEEFTHVAAQGMEPADFLGLFQNRSLKRLSVGFGSVKKNKILRELASKAGIGEAQSSKFVFV